MKRLMRHGYIPYSLEPETDTDCLVEHWSYVGLEFRLMARWDPDDDGHLVRRLWVEQNEGDCWTDITDRIHLAAYQAFEHRADALNVPSILNPKPSFKKPGSFTSWLRGRAA